MKNRIRTTLLLLGSTFALLTFFSRVTEWFFVKGSAVEISKARTEAVEPTVS